MSLPSPTHHHRSSSPKQWQESIFENNFAPVPIEVDNRRPVVQPPAHFEQLTFLEKLMYTGKHSPSALTKLPSPTRASTAGAALGSPGASGTFKLQVLEPEKQRRQVSFGHETSVLVKPTKMHVDAFRQGLDSTPPLKIIKHVKVGVKLPKMQSGNTSPSICRNYAGGFYAAA